MGGTMMSTGYLIATRYQVLYEQALASHRYDAAAHHRPIYGVPSSEHPTPPAGAPRYRGIDRNSLAPLSFHDARLFAEAWPSSGIVATEATDLLAAIQRRAGRLDDWISTVEDAVAVWGRLGSDMWRYELIFGKEFDDPATVPSFCTLLGYDVAAFGGDNFSCICDALFFPRWHGTDADGLLFADYYASLNANGLFDSNVIALSYRDYYLSFDWTEHGVNFTSIAVYGVNLDAVRTVRQ
jgi:hypothetical protein